MRNGEGGGWGWGSHSRWANPTYLGQQSGLGVSTLHFCSQTLMHARNSPAAWREGPHVVVICNARCRVRHGTCIRDNSCHLARQSCPPQGLRLGTRMPKLYMTFPWSRGNT